MVEYNNRRTIDYSFAWEELGGEEEDVEVVEGP